VCGVGLNCSAVHGSCPVYSGEASHVVQRWASYIIRILLDMYLEMYCTYSAGTAWQLVPLQAHFVKRYFKSKFAV
jgi:hypothetical protein